MSEKSQSSFFVALKLEEVAMFQEMQSVSRRERQRNGFTSGERKNEKEEEEWLILLGPHFSIFFHVSETSQRETLFCISLLYSDFFVLSLELSLVHFCKTHFFSAALASWRRGN